MNKLVMLVCISIAWAATASAADIIELPAARGNISFPHKKHQGLPFKCATCHDPGVWKIAGLGKEWAHNVCRGCHAETAKAPVNCTGCHKQ